MNRILASFTSSERNIITFVLVTAAIGYGMLQWRDDQQTAMTFIAAPAAASEDPFPVEKVLPKGMDAEGRIDINVADQELLETLPGVGPALAGAIMGYREEHGALASMQDLDAVPGIGPAMMAKLSPLVGFGDAAAGNPTAPAPPVLPGGVPGGDAPNGGVPVNSLAPPNAENPAVAGAPVNINTASASELDTLKGVGPALAQRIIEERSRGAFRRVEEITRVRGIGPKILQDNFYRMTVQ